MQHRLGAGNFLHEHDDAFAVIAAGDAYAFHAQTYAASTAVDGIHLRPEVLISLPQQCGQGLFQLFDGQPDIQTEEVLPLHFVRAQSPQVRGDVVPELHLQVSIEHDDGRSMPR